MKKRKAKAYRVLHTPTTVGGNPQGLSNSLNKLGINSKSLTLEQNYFKYPADHVLWSEGDGYIAKELKRLLLLVSIIFQYDVIHYNFGTTIAAPIYSIRPNDSVIVKWLKFTYCKYSWVVQWFELNLFKLLKKPLFVTYQGNDARQGDFCVAHFEFNIAAQVGEEYYTQKSDELKRKMISRMSRYCHSIYALNPDLFYVLPKKTKFMPYAHVFLDEWMPHFNQLENRKLRIGHAPSNRKVKGTDIILEALEKLKKRGYEFELVLVEGVSNAEARKTYETVDILIDQIFAGWYGGLAVEAMALGKPVLVYIRQDDLKYVPAEMAADLPFFQIDPKNLEEQLRTVLDLPRQELLKIARRSRAYVERWHDPLRIASALKSDYETALAEM